MESVLFVGRDLARGTPVNIVRYCSKSGEPGTQLTMRTGGAASSSVEHLMQQLQFQEVSN